MSRTDFNFWSHRPTTTSARSTDLPHPTSLPSFPNRINFCSSRPADGPISHYYPGWRHMDNNCNDQYDDCQSRGSPQHFREVFDHNSIKREVPGNLPSAPVHYSYSMSPADERRKHEINLHPSQLSRSSDYYSSDHQNVASTFRKRNREEEPENNFAMENERSLFLSSPQTKRSSPPPSGHSGAFQSRQPLTSSLSFDEKSNSPNSRDVDYSSKNMRGSNPRSILIDEEEAKHSRASLSFILNPSSTTTTTTSASPTSTTEPEYPSTALSSSSSSSSNPATHSTVSRPKSYPPIAVTTFETKSSSSQSISRFHHVKQEKHEDRTSEPSSKSPSNSVFNIKSEKNGRTSTPPPPQTSLLSMTSVNNKPLYFFSDPNDNSHHQINQNTKQMSFSVTSFKAEPTVATSMCYNNLFSSSSSFNQNRAEQTNLDHSAFFSDTQDTDTPDEDKSNDKEPQPKESLICLPPELDLRGSESRMVSLSSVIENFLQRRNQSISSSTSSPSSPPTMMKKEMKEPSGESLLRALIGSKSNKTQGILEKQLKELYIPSIKTSFYFCQELRKLVGMSGFNMYRYLRSKYKVSIYKTCPHQMNFLFSLGVVNPTMKYCCFVEISSVDQFLFDWFEKKYLSIRETNKLR